MISQRYSTEIASVGRRLSIKPDFFARILYPFETFFSTQEELKIDDDCFEDLQSLYKLLDLDKDGILNFKEFEKLMRCLGYRLTGKGRLLSIYFRVIWRLKRAYGTKNLGNGYCDSL